LTKEVEIMMGWTRLAQQRPGEAARRLAIMTGLTLVMAVASSAPALADDRPDGAEMATAGSMMVVISIAFVLAALALLWSHKNGEYDEPEEVKYQMLAVTEDEIDFWGMGTHDEEEDLYEDETPRRLIARPAVR
jgi:cbb3-type cytochrome oxidase maturation protein